MELRRQSCDDIGYLTIVVTVVSFRHGNDVKLHIHIALFFTVHWLLVLMTVSCRRSLKQSTIYPFIHLTNSQPASLITHRSDLVHTIPLNENSNTLFSLNNWNLFANIRYCLHLFIVDVVVRWKGLHCEDCHRFLCWIRSCWRVLHFPPSRWPYVQSRRSSWRSLLCCIPIIVLQVTTSLLKVASCFQIRSKALTHLSSAS